MDLNLDEAVVIHNEQAQRFETSIGNQFALLTYRRAPGRITFLHAEVPAPFEGQGLAAKVTRTALDYARANHLEVIPVCPFVSSFIKKHREYQDLVPTEQLNKILSG